MRQTCIWSRSTLAANRTDLGESAALDAISNRAWAAGGDGTYYRYGPPLPVEGGSLAVPGAFLRVRGGPVGVGGVEGVDGLTVERVELLRPVDGDDGDPVGDIEEQVGVGGHGPA